MTWLGVINTTWENLQIAKHNQSTELSGRVPLFLFPFSISLFLFPIVFGINVRSRAQISRCHFSLSFCLHLWVKTQQQVNLHADKLHWHKTFKMTLRLRVTYTIIPEWLSMIVNSSSSPRAWPEGVQCLKRPGPKVEWPNSHRVIGLA